jgi:hypothetical protein
MDCREVYKALEGGHISRRDHFISPACKVLGLFRQVNSYLLSQALAI